MAKIDRRVQRARQLLQKALIELIGERAYDAIAIQDIVDRAGVGRTTFYLHYSGKDELFLSCHEAFLGEFHFGPHYSLSREELLSPEPPPGMIAAYRRLDDARALLYLLAPSRSMCWRPIWLGHSSGWSNGGWRSAGPTHRNSWRGPSTGYRASQSALPSG